MDGASDVIVDEKAQRSPVDYRLYTSRCPNANTLQFLGAPNITPSEYFTSFSFVSILSFKNLKKKNEKAVFFQITTTQWF